MTLAAGLAGCDDDTLTRRVDPPDSGVHPDAPAPDAPAPDAEEPDAGFEDSGAPDALVAPDAAEPEPATEPVYINTGDSLYSYDPNTNRATAIGSFRQGNEPITGMVDIAIDLSGRMYGGTTERELFRIDPTDATCRFIATHDDLLHGLTFVSDGRLVVAGRRVSTVDPRTGARIEELVPEGVYETSGDIIGLPDGKLYWSVRGDAREGDGLVQIDPDTGDTRYQGQGAVPAIYGLGYAYGVLYGFGRDGVAVTIDRNSGQVVDEKVLDGRWYGATTNPVLW